MQVNHNNPLHALSLRPIHTGSGLGPADAKAAILPREVPDAPAPSGGKARHAANVAKARDVKPITVEELLKNWGGSDERFDLNTDGVVNMADLLQLLATLKTRSQPAPTDLRSIDDRTSLNPNVTDPAPDAGNQVGDQRSIDGLLDAWGEKRPNYDLNHDGTVNMGDLLDRLAGMKTTELPVLGAPDGVPATGDATNVAANVLGAPEPPPIEPDATSIVSPVTDDAVAASPARPDDGPLTVDGLLADWGENDSRYDLDSNGVVNMGDLLRLLTTLRNETGSPTNVADDPPRTLDGLLDVWGTANRRYDLDRNGVVNMGDLVRLLGRLSSSQRHDQDGTRTSIAPRTQSVRPGPDPRDTTAARPLARSLAETLRSNGYDQQLPPNIQDLVGKLRLSAFQQQALLASLGREFPDGLGVNVEA